MTGHDFILRLVIDIYNGLFILGQQMFADPASSAIDAALSGDWEKAVAANIVIVAEDGEDVDALNRLARAYIETGNQKMARETLSKIKKIDPYNQIAKKNTDRLALTKQKKSLPNAASSYNQVDFIEEPGRVRVVALTNLAPIRSRRNLNCGQIVVLEPKRRGIRVLDGQGHYLGALPDDLGHRLYILLKGGNTYTACLKSTSIGLVVLIKELTRSKKYQSIPSFPTNNAFIEPADRDQEVFIDPVKPKTDPDDDDESPPKAITLHSDEESEEPTLDRPAHP